MPYCSQFIPMEIINLPKHKSICYHPSLLPRHRGASAISWTLIEGDTKGGFSIFWPDDGLDTGPILLQVSSMFCPMGIHLSLCGSNTDIRTKELANAKWDIFVCDLRPRTKELLELLLFTFVLISPLKGFKWKNSALPNRGPLAWLEPQWLSSIKSEKDQYIANFRYSFNAESSLYFVPYSENTTIHLIRLFIAMSWRP